jgi:hypothetical protein
VIIPGNSVKADELRSEEKRTFFTSSGDQVYNYINIMITLSTEYQSSRK